MLLRAAVVALVVVFTAACGGGGDDPAVIQVTSTAFDDGGAIPSRYSCEDLNASPPIAWTNVPMNTVELAVVLDDPDAPRGTFVHWAMVNLPGGTRSLAENEKPNSAIELESDTGNVGYAGPCPPNGETHTYRVRVFAFAEAVDLPDGATAATAVPVLEERASSIGTLEGTFGR